VHLLVAAAFNVYSKLCLVYTDMRKERKEGYGGKIYGHERMIHREQ
jgi:hypothetical protein